MDELCDCMKYHAYNGFEIRMTHWKVMHYDRVDVKREGSLVSPLIDNEIYVFPCGTFECGCCEKVKPLNENDLAIFDEGVARLLCFDCAVVSDNLSGARAVSLTYIGGPVDVVSYESVESGEVDYVDMRAKTEFSKEFLLEIANDLCRVMASEHDCLYLQGMDSHALYERRLARKYLAKWVNRIRVRRANALYCCLYHGAAIGKDASYDITRAIVPAFRLQSAAFPVA